MRLIACPFCGSTAMIQTWETNQRGVQNGWRAGCLEPDCDMNPCTKTRWSTEEEAIKSWNRRTYQACPCCNGDRAVIGTVVQPCPTCNDPAFDMAEMPYSKPNE